MSIDQRRLQEKLQFIRQNLSRLRFLGQMGQEEFLSDFRNIETATRLLQTAIEAIIDIGNHIVARKAIGMPRSYAETFHLLAEKGDIEPTQVPMYEAMVRFRNRAVHLYSEVEPRQVYDILQTHLEDFETFMRSMIKRYLANGTDSPVAPLD